MLDPAFPSELKNADVFPVFKKTGIMLKTTIQ